MKYILTITSSFLDRDQYIKYESVVKEDLAKRLLFEAYSKFNPQFLNGCFIKIDIHESIEKIQSDSYKIIQVDLIIKYE